MRLLSGPALFILLAACAQQPPRMTLSEREAVLTRTYAATASQVVAAAERLFSLADGDDFRFEPTANGMVAIRDWSAFLLLVGVRGVDTWTLITEQTPEGVRARIHLRTDSESFSAVATPGGVALPTSSTTLAPSVEGTAIYDVFWARMDYLLGERKDWMTCETANRRVAEGLTWGTNEALCNSFNMRDAAP